MNVVGLTEKDADDKMETNGSVWGLLKGENQKI